MSCFISFERKIEWWSVEKSGMCLESVENLKLKKSKGKIWFEKISLIFCFWENEFLRWNYNGEKIERGEKMKKAKNYF